MSKMLRVKNFKYTVIEVRMVQEQSSFNMQSEKEVEFFQDHTLSFTNFQSIKQRTLQRGTYPLYSNAVMSEFHKFKSVLSLIPQF